MTNEELRKKQERLKALQSSLIILFDGLTNQELRDALQPELTKRGLALSSQGDLNTARYALTQLQSAQQLLRSTPDLQRGVDAINNALSQYVY